jgi:hypothetical protein
VFERRKPLLMSIIGRRLRDDAVERFLSTVGGRPGRYLLMEPDEVLGGITMIGPRAVTLMTVFRVAARQVEQRYTPDSRGTSVVVGETFKSLRKTDDTSEQSG